MPSTAGKPWNFRDVKGNHYIVLKNKFAKILFQADLHDVYAACQNFCNIIKKAAKKTISRGRRNNYIRAGMRSVNPSIPRSCSLLRRRQSLPATALIPKLDRKRRD